MIYLAAIPFQGSRWTRRRSVGLVAGTLLLLLIVRLRVGGAPPEFATADNPAARHPSRLARGLTFLYLPAANARMLLCPSTLSFDWSMDAVPRITTIKDPRNLESAALYAALAGAGLWAAKGLRASCSMCVKKNGSHTDRCRAANNNNAPISNCYCPKRSSVASLPLAVAVSLGFLGLPFLPASNLFFYVGFVIAERVLYLPSVGFCLLFGAGVCKLYRIARRKSRASRRIVLAVAIVLLTLMAAKTLRRNLDWYDEESLYRSALHVNPPKGKYLKRSTNKRNTANIFHRACPPRCTVSERLIVSRELPPPLRRAPEYRTLLSCSPRAPKV